MSFWKGKKVFLTGHTGFKGSWTGMWLVKMGAEVTGYSLPPPTDPSHFNELKLDKEMKSVIGDISDIELLAKTMSLAKPEIIIHMAAQPLVRYSYDFPVETYRTNIMGTVNLFEAIRKCDSVRCVVNVTSDKCYENQEREEGYKENEPMGGYDPYSSSKGCAELVTSAYKRSFFEKKGVQIASGRAGNVIGGGDWAQDRIVPDIVRSVIKNDTLIIRNPHATRPWQHVLEPIGGYLTLAQKMYEQGGKYAEPFNFGPSKADHCSVEKLLVILNQYWSGKLKYKVEQSEKNPHEAKLLSLNCEKAREVLGWEPHWDLHKALEMTVQWNKRRLDGESVQKISSDQINEYNEV